ncbi:MAG: hypothetical protein EHM70_02120 [Chloroflexota bacterium]|nr:MAG: hypothetical protein EHM70_02120 [Chloroflexota bacterium]
MELNHTCVDHIPVVWLDPGLPSGSRRLAIWLPWFTGRKEDMQSQLAGLADRGFVALSYDPWQHGERGTEDPDALLQRVFGNFRRHMWPILAHTAEDALRVIDWAIAMLDISPDICMGGISMGGDISVAAAGLDQRISTVAAIVATPDWMRPGMDISPGEPDAYSQHLYDRFNPITHLGSYSHCPAITFECGAEDGHVPPDGALRFQEVLKDTYAACPERLRGNLHPGVGHKFVEPMWANSLEWFSIPQI